MKPPRPPSEIRLGSVAARAVPSRGVDAKGCWYWRIEWTRRVQEGTSRSLWSGRGTEAQINRLVGEYLARDTGPRATSSPAASAPASVAGLRTLDELLRAYDYHLQHERPDLSAGTLRAYNLRGRQWKKAGAAGIRLDRVNGQVLEHLRGELLRLWSPRTARTLLEHVGAAWSWARARSYVPDRDVPVPRVSIPKAVRPRATLTEGLAVAEAQEIPWRRVGIMLMTRLGARVGEVAKLKRTSVDLARGTILLDGKTGPRLLPLPPDLAAELGTLLESHTRPEALGVTYNSARVGLDRATRKVLKAGTHVFRRGAVDRFARSGVDIGTAAAILGHTPEVMLTAYREVTAGDMTKALELPAGQVLPFRRLG